MTIDEGKKILMKVKFMLVAEIKIVRRKERWFKPQRYKGS